MNLKYLLGVAALGTVIGFIGYVVIGYASQASDNVTFTLVPSITDSFQQLIPNNKIDVPSKVVEHLEVNNSQVLHLEGPVDQNAVALANQIKVLEINKKPIYLLIDSPGGSVLDGARLVSAVQEAKVPVYTVCMELCASMAAIIHQYGTKRYVATRSLLMFHNAAMGLGGQLPEMMARLNMMNNYTQKMDAYIAKRSGQTLEQFNNKFSHELWLDDDESLKDHYADGIVSITVKDLPPSVPVFGFNSNNNMLNFRWE